MPIYEYDCAKCGRFEVLQKMSALPLKKHDVCGAKVTKMMSASSFAFKGSGFYQTDYKKLSEKQSGQKSEKQSEKQGDKKLSDKKTIDASCASASPKNEACASCPAKDGKAA